MEAKPAQARSLSSGSRIGQIYFDKRKWFDLCLFALFASITFILYHSSINNFYVVDDFVRLKAVSDASLGENFHYFPVPLSVYRLFFLLFGPGPEPIRITSLLLNALVCLFVFKTSLTVFRLFHNESDNINLLKSFLVSLFFCVHYIHLETLIYYAALHEVFYSLFYILGLYAYLHFREKYKKSYLISVILFFGFCIFSKETAISFILCVFAGDLLLFKKKISDFVKEFYFLFVITLLFVVIRYFEYPKFEALSYSFGIVSFISESVKNVIFTFTAFIVSLDFTLLRDIYKASNSNIIATIKGVWQFYPLALAGVLFSFIVYFNILRKSDKIIYLSFIFVIITIGSFMWLAGYERYLYLPSIGFWLMVLHYAFVLLRTTKHFRVFIVAVLLLFFIYNIYSLRQKKYYWETAAEISRNTVMNIVSLTNNLPSGSIVYFHDIPTEYKGAWIIRYEVHLFPELFLKRNDVFFYYLYERKQIDEHNKKVYVYNYIGNRLVEE